MLTTIDMTEKLQEVQNELHCSICHDYFVQAYTLICSHSFCLTCINAWRQQHSDCPMCRRVITSMTPSRALDNMVATFRGGTAEGGTQNAGAFNLAADIPPAAEAQQVHQVADYDSDDNNRSNDEHYEIWIDYNGEDEESSSGSILSYEADYEYPGGEEIYEDGEEEEDYEDGEEEGYVDSEEEEDYVDDESGDYTDEEVEEEEYNESGYNEMEGNSSEEACSFNASYYSGSDNGFDSVSDGGQYDIDLDIIDYDS